MIQVRELLNKARCLLKKDDPQQALACFEEARAVSADDELADEIEVLRVESLSQADLYNAGFDLAQLGKFTDCLSYWQYIRSGHPDFQAQKEAVSVLLIQELARCLAEGPICRETEVRERLSILSDSGINIEQLAGEKELVDRCRALRLARLWRDGRMSEIMQGIDEVDLLHPTVLEIQAKAAYRLMETEGVRASLTKVRHFIDCWLSSLFHPAVVATLSDKEAEAEQRRQDLLDVGMKMVRKYSEQEVQDGDLLVRLWEEQLALLKLLTGISAVAKEGKDGEKDEVAVLLYTSTLACRAGIAEQIFSFVREHQEQFPDYERCIAAGAAYSPIASALLMARNHQYDEALNQLAQLEDRLEIEVGEVLDPFIAHAVAEVKIACGLQYFKSGRLREAEEIIANVLHVIRQPPPLQQQLLSAFGKFGTFGTFDIAGKEEYAADQLAVSVKIIEQLQKLSPSDEVNKTLCSLLTRQVAQLHNQGKTHSKILLKSIEKAVALNPDDALARLTLDDVKTELEIVTMQQAVNQGKLAKAAYIAKNSAYQQVVEQFFEFAAQVVEQIEVEEHPDEETGGCILQQLMRNVRRVNPDHTIIQDIEHVLDRLEQKMGA